MGNQQPVEAPTPVKPDAHLPTKVWALAWVAFSTDTFTEMGYWLLPQFLVIVLGAPPMAFGLIEGAAETVASFLRLRALCALRPFQRARSCCQPALFLGLIKFATLAASSRGYPKTEN
jgi:hypothetical protein